MERKERGGSASGDLKQFEVTFLETLVLALEGVALRLKLPFLPIQPVENLQGIFAEKQRADIKAEE
jgi:hypothetical protein